MEDQHRRSPPRNDLSLRRGSSDETSTSSDHNDLNLSSHSSPDSCCCVLAAPPDSGLLISLDTAAICRMTFVPDANWNDIHPNIYAPANLDDVRTLRGGGSGVAVFRGLHPDLGDLVMKHGGYKDTVEVFALAKITQELSRRSISKEAEIAAARMRARVPEFRFVYISPCHLRDRGEQLWSIVRDAVFTRAFSKESIESLDTSTHGVSNNIVGSHSGRLCCGKSEGRKIDLIVGKEDAPSVKVLKDRFVISLGPHATILGEGGVQYCGPQSEGFTRMSAFIDQFKELQKDNFWKFTLAQKKIGDGCSSTASSLLAAGLLKGDLLNGLIDEFILTIRSLQILTLKEEMDAVEDVKKEMTKYENESHATLAEVSPLADSFVGFAIRKNFHPSMGRFKSMRDMGAAFRRSTLVLTEQEELPARYLGILLRRGARMEEAFVSAPSENTPLDDVSDAWRVLLRRAAGLKSKAALDRIWTGGLTDAGLHNMFLGPDQIWLFDLGEPSLQPLPAFLTKFLMSFFHTLGMEETDDGDWVRRFEAGDRLLLTAETISILPKAHDAFNVTVASLVDVLFDGEHEVQALLVDYIILQLLSDAAFCLQRWEVKGGGSERIGGYDKALEKWLWRALWDIYVAADVKSNL